MYKSKPFFILAIAMAGIVAVSNFLVQYPINHFGMENILTYAAFTYPITFLITDLSNRYLSHYLNQSHRHYRYQKGILKIVCF